MLSVASFSSEGVGLNKREEMTNFWSHNSRLEMQMQVWLQMTLDGDHSQLSAGHPYC